MSTNPSSADFFGLIGGSNMPKPSVETLPLGGDYQITQTEVEALWNYLENHDAGESLRIWRGTSGTLYLQLAKGSLYPLSPEQ